MDTGLDGATPERHVPPRVAIEEAHAALASLGLVVEERDLSADERFPVTRCAARDSEGVVRSRSSGKGMGLQARASGLYELLEHYCLDSSRRPAPAAGRYLSCADLRNQPELAAHGLIRRISPALDGCAVQCSPYVSLDDPNTSLWFPVFMRDPGYLLHPGTDRGVADRYRRFSSSAGIASGRSFDDALLHAVSELCEHDSFSAALAEWFLCEPTDDPRIRIVEPSSLPTAAGTLLEALASTFGRPPSLVDITSASGLPAYLAVFERPNGMEAATIGLGCSLDPDYAALRALLEVWQGLHIDFDDLILAHSHSTRLAGRAARWPWIAQAVRLPIDDLVAARGARPVTLGVVAQSDIPAMVREVADRIRTMRLEIFYQPAFEAEGATVVDVLVPGLELLDAVREGAFIPPTGRLGHVLNR